MQLRQWKVGAVLLAAGEGSRMGGLPKCLLTLDGTPLIQRHLAAMRAAGIHDVVVVTGYHHAQIEPVAEAVDATIVRNEKPEEGQQSSVSIGVQALGNGFDLVIIALADQPLIGPAEFAELINAFKSRGQGTQIVYPCVRGQRGNPVVFAGELITQLRRSGKQVPGRKFIDEHPQLVHVYETDNECFIIDLDTRDDVETLEQRTGYKFELPAIVRKD